MHRYPFLVLCSMLAGSVLFTPQSGAQKGQPPVGPQAPNVAMPMPMGMQRGGSFELVLTGANLAEPVALMTSIPGLKATFPEDNNNGKDPAKLRVVLEAPKDTPIGTHTLRLVTARGMSNLRLFCVDDLPQVNQDPASKAKSTPQALTVPGVVAGRIDAESSNFYKISVTAGQKLSFDVLGRRLGSPLDPQLSIIDPKNQREIAYSNDAPGQQTDARLTHTFKEAGEFHLEIRDVMHRGGADYVYRLRIGDFPCATTPVPMAAKRGGKVNVAFAGPAVEGVAPVEVNVPTDPAVNTVWVAPKGASGLHGWPVALVVSDFDEVAEQEPNNDPAKATPVPVPGGVTGRFEQKSDVDYFKLPLKKGRWIIEAQTLELYSPTEVFMSLKDGKGADVAKVDPKAAPRLDYTAKDDGDFTLAVEHLHYWGGPGETYRITILPYEPTIDVTLGSERFDLPQGSAALVPIQAVVAKDYKGPIELSVVGHPGVTGSKTINSEAKAAQPNQPIGLMLISSAPDVPMGGYPIRVQAKATINGKPVVGYANVRPTLSAALGGLPFPPRQLGDQLVVAVTEKPPFTLTAKFDVPESLKGAKVNVTILAARADGFDGDIALSPVGLPPNVTPVVKNIAKGTNEIKAELTIAAGAAYGDFPISFTGKAKHNNKDFAVIAAPVSLVVALPFDLKVEPSPFKLDVGEKAKLKVVAARKGGYKGPIAVEVKGLPANVTAAKANIDMDKDDVEIEVAAAANAAAGEKADVNVVGIAAAAANQQNTSPNFTITVNKK